MNEQAAATRGRCFGEPGPSSHDEASDTCRSNGACYDWYAKQDAEKEGALE